MTGLSSTALQTHKLLSENNSKGLKLLKSLSKQDEIKIREKFSIVFPSGFFLPLDTKIYNNEFIYKDTYFNRDERPSDVKKCKYIQFDSTIKNLIPTSLQYAQIISTPPGFFKLVEPRSHNKNQMKNIIDKMEQLRETQDSLRRLKMKRGRSGPREETECLRAENDILRMEKELHSINFSTCPKYKEIETYMKTVKDPINILTLKTKFCERVLEQESNQVIELLPSWYIHINNIDPDNFYEIIEKICSHYPIAWLKKAGVKCVVSSAVCQNDKSESQLLQNIPAWQHIRIRMIDAWARKNDISNTEIIKSLCDYMGILKSNEDVLCQLHTK